MERVELELYRSLLEELGVEVVKRKDETFRTVVEEAKQLQGQVLDEGDKSEVGSRTVVNIGPSDSLNQTLVKIRDAVSRIDQGTFGTCTGCAGDIPLTRLAAVPFEGLCAECKNSEELELGRTKPPESVREGVSGDHGEEDME